MLFFFPPKGHNRSVTELEVTQILHSKDWHRNTHRSNKMAAKSMTTFVSFKYFYFLRIRLACKMDRLLLQHKVRRKR